MTRDSKARGPTDAELVAYLDGELSPADSVRIGQQLASDPSLKARMEQLTRGARPFREAFEPLLAEAPIERLEQNLAAALARPSSPSGRRLILGSLGATRIVAAIALMIAGAGLDRIVVAPVGTALLSWSSPKPDDSEDWRRAVARYLALYTTDTLAIVPEAAEAGAEDLARVGGRLGLALTPARVALPDLRLKRAEMFTYDGQVLAFLAYLDPQSGPVALCIINGHSGDDARRSEQRRGMNIVYWSQGRHSFMLIGRAAPAQLRGFADTVAARFDVKADDRG